MDPLKTLTEYLGAVSSLGRSTKGMWYRGIKDSSLSVLPGVYWRGLEAEWNLTTGFKTRATPLLEDTERLALAQSTDNR